MEVTAAGSSEKRRSGLGGCTAPRYRSHVSQRQPHLVSNASLTSNALPWGVVFSKEFVYDRGGAPIHYVRSDEWDDYQKLSASLRARAVEIRRGQSE